MISSTHEGSLGAHQKPTRAPGYRGEKVVFTTAAAPLEMVAALCGSRSEFDPSIAWTNGSATPAAINFLRLTRKSVMVNRRACSGRTWAAAPVARLVGFRPRYSSGECRCVLLGAESPASSAHLDPGPRCSHPARLRCGFSLFPWPN